MLYVYTLFDKNRDSRPLIAGVYDADTKSLEFFTLYLRNTNKSIYDIERSAQRLGEIITSAKRVMLNDCKQHLIAYNFEYRGLGHVLDVDVPPISSKMDVKQCRKIVAAVLAKMHKIKPQYWQAVRAGASVVYSNLQKRGVLYGYEPRYPIWGRVYSGRSKSTGFNVQGLGREHLTNPNGGKVFLNFDWIAADMRIITIMSGDEKLDLAFKHSDPYQYLVDHLNKGVDRDRLVRDEGKRLMLSSAYSFDDDNPALDFYGGFRSWITRCRMRLARNGYLTSILNRRFSMTKGRTERSVFNAMIQGSVAHAMQLCLKRVWDLFYNDILTENHDSLVVTCSKENASNEIIEISKIMIQPFKGILRDNPQFPIRVSVGSGYKNWSYYKRYNCCEQIK